MIIKVEVNGLVYDSTNSACLCLLSSSQNEVFAFLQVLDGPEKKRYWGKYSHAMPAESIKKIMETGGKWPTLPK